MKRFFVAMAALCCALTALAGCTRHGAPCGVDFCVCGLEEGTAVRDTQSDLVTFDNAQAPVEDEAADVAAKEDAPAVVVPKTPDAAETAKEPVVAEAADDAAEAAPNDDEEAFSAEEMAQKIRAIEESTKNEPQIIQGIIDEGYDDVPAIVSEAPAVNEEVKEAALQEMAADYALYLDIESYDAEEAVVEAPGLPAVIEAIEPVIAEAPEAPAVEEPAAELPAPEPAAQEEVSFLLPPPLSSAPEPGPAAFAAEVEADRSGATEELTLEGLDDMELEFFGSISESLLEADS